MAFPTVEAVNGGSVTENSLTHVINLPSGITSGDLLILFKAYRGGWATGEPTLSGWTEITRQNFSTTSCWVAYRIADGGEGSTATITLTSSASESAHVTYRISGHHTSTIPEVTFPISPSSTLTPDPPSHVASWGAEDNLWIAGATRRDIGDASISSYSTNYTNGQYFRGGGAGDEGVITAQRQLNTDTEDPGVITISGTVDDALPFTLAVRPASSAPVGHPAFSRFAGIPFAAGSTPRIQYGWR